MVVFFVERSSPILEDLSNLLLKLAQSAIFVYLCKYPLIYAPQVLAGSFLIGQFKQITKPVRPAMRWGESRAHRETHDLRLSL